MELNKNVFHRTVMKVNFRIIFLVDLQEGYMSCSGGGRGRGRNDALILIRCTRPLELERVDLFLEELHWYSDGSYFTSAPLR